MANRAELQRRLADGFAARGLQYDTDVASRVIDSIGSSGTVDAHSITQAMPAVVLAGLGASRDEFRSAVDAAIGGMRLDDPVSAAAISFTINDHRHSVSIGSGASVSETEINTGSVVNVNSDSTSDELLDAISTLVTAGLGGDWNVEAAAELGSVVDARPDISYEDVQLAVANAASSVGADKESARALMSGIAKDALGGALGTGIVAALAAIT